jgi:phage gp29-like protein
MQRSDIFMKTHTLLPQLKSQRSGFRPVNTLTPESLSRTLEAFHRGDLKSAAHMWDMIEKRDDVLQGVINKRKKSVARLGWEILMLEDSDEAHAHKLALEYFYHHLKATHACDENEQGGFALLIKQMMDAVAKRYAVHEIVFEPREKGLTATFRFVPLWFFENREGRLKFIKDGYDSKKNQSLESGEWLITTGDGLMEASSIAYLFKHLPLCDWLLYCERNGMPGVKGSTDALPGTPEWEAARHAVADFGAEFSALMSRGTDIEPIDLTSRGELPYPRLIERMDRALIALWRGSDLSTLSSSQGSGASLQQNEADLLEDDDALSLSETLNAQVDRFIIQHLFQTDEPKAYIRLKIRDRRDRASDIQLIEKIHAMNLPLAKADLYERFGIPTPMHNEPLL